MAKTTTLALRPFLETVEALCRSMSQEKLVAMLLAWATDIPASDRAAFLAQIRKGESKPKAVPVAEPGYVQQFLKEIEELERDICQRVESIEDGSFWDDYHGDEGYGYDEDADPLSREHKEELVSCFAEADRIFLHGSRSDARTVYGRLFQAVKTAAGYDGGWIDIDVDLRESRARYCRCVYELTTSEERLSAMLEAMEVEAQGRLFAEGSPRDYPTLHDVIDAQSGQLPDFDDFLSQWTKALAAKGFMSPRLAGLRLEAAAIAGGIEALAALARQWRDKQPLAYLYWCRQLSEGGDWSALMSAAREALEALPAGQERSNAANFLIEAGEHCQDATAILEGKRQRFASMPASLALLALVGEAERQEVREQELDWAVSVLNRQRQQAMFDENLFALTLLMAGRIEDAFVLAQKAKPVGWSSGSPAAVMCAAVLFLIGRGRETGLIDSLFKSYTEGCGIFFHDSVREGESIPDMDQEVRKGLALISLEAEQLARYFSWAQSISEKRVNHIVSNKHRNAYDRAAHILCALAEAHWIHSGRQEAESLLREYYQNRYNRYPAFRKELKEILGKSSLLRGVKL